MASPKKETNHEQDILHLFQAISKGKAHLTRFMLAASGPTLLNCFNDEGRTPLMECCYIREEATRVNMVKTIRDAGADVNQKDEYGRTALIHACQERCNDVVRILIMHCQIIPDAEDNDGNTALIHSARNGNDVAVELLVRNFRRLGLQVDHLNKEGYGALHIAAKNGFIQCAMTLATKGKATLTLKDKVNNMTPLEICLAEGYQKSEVEFLKPSVKFYKVAKLTTTMVKYRKKSSSGQESITSKISPVKTVEKEKKQKSKLSLLKKSKHQGSEAGSSNNSSSSGVHKQRLLDQGNENVNSSDKDKAMSSVRDVAKITGQQRYTNITDNSKSSDGLILHGTGLIQEGVHANKHSPIAKRNTDSHIDVGKVNRPKVLTTSNSMTSPFTEKDFVQAEALGNFDEEDVNMCSMATDTTFLDSDEMRSESGIPTIEKTTYYGDRVNSNTALKTNNHNNNNNNNSIDSNNKNNTKCGLQQRNETDSKVKDLTNIGGEEEDGGEGLDKSENDYESVSDCTLPSMSPVTQMEYADDMSSPYEDDSNNSGSQLLADSKKYSPLKTHSENPRKVSTSPQTEVEYMYFDDDQTNNCDSESAENKDMMSNSGNSNIIGGPNTCEDKPNFDQIVTGRLLKLIGENTKDESFEGTTSASSGMANGPIPSQIGVCLSSSPKSELENNRKPESIVNSSRVECISNKEHPALIDRNNSATPETIIESLDAISIPKDVCDSTKTKIEHSIDVLRFTADSADSKLFDTDINESTS